ncbi:MAG: biopolymer transporter ExbD [Sulfuricurvum sp.]|uniref:ExbD/TolR family protein n=1 Tax=Sulfuricurvum sp. TaxID=2025608 RepID=UPI0026030E55|nr:biopolymer transporter ExbD [Sulfuricurvum sp.]MDD2368490.1 biopolymer transporter ExbD [Sulfuricurvum sp.]MDD2950285.1 biopolymer transporter ExbD [Sulfuricurvum sp.]MDD5119246.1 biopolymer transporter ExbD [Sulfuricurvum sp.]
MFDWDEKPELNITPLVDVMLVLLAILMVISPNIVYEELIRLPKGSAQQELTKIPPVNITISKDGEVTVNKEPFKLDTFADNFALFAQTLDHKATVLISADQSLDYGKVMSILGAVKQAGFRDVSLATNG